MRTSALVLVTILLAAGPARSDVEVLGNLEPKRRVAFAHGLNLTSALTRLDSIGCTELRVTRNQDGQETNYIVSLPALLIEFENDFALMDQDQIFVPDHMFPCMSPANSKKFPRIIDEFVALKASNSPKPRNWDKRVIRHSGCGRPAK